MLWNCGSEKPQEGTASAEQMSLEVNESEISEDEISKKGEEEASGEDAKADENEENSSVAEDATDKKANTKPSNNGWADMKLEEETYYFGTVEEGDIVKHSFKFEDACKH